MQYKKIIVYFLIINSSFYKFCCDYSFGMESNIPLSQAQELYEKQRKIDELQSTMEKQSEDIIKQNLQINSLLKTTTKQDEQSRANVRLIQIQSTQITNLCNQLKQINVDVYPFASDEQRLRWRNCCVKSQMEIIDQERKKNYWKVSAIIGFVILSILLVIITERYCSLKILHS